MYPGNRNYNTGVDAGLGNPNPTVVLSPAGRPE